MAGGRVSVGMARGVGAGVTAGGWDAVAVGTGVGDSWAATGVAGPAVGVVREAVTHAVRKRARISHSNTGRGKQCENLIFDYNDGAIRVQSSSI